MELDESKTTRTLRTVRQVAALGATSAISDCILLVTHAGIAAGVGRGVSSRLSVCPFFRAVKGKRLELLAPKSVGE